MADLPEPHAASGRGRWRSAVRWRVLTGGVVAATAAAVMTTTSAFAGPVATGSVATGGALFVAPTGDDANPGTVTSPLASIQRAVDLVEPGGTIIVRSGTYRPVTNIQILKSGTQEAPITLAAHRGEHVVIDGEDLPHTPAPLGGSIPRAERGAIHMEASWWRLIGLEIVNGPYAVYCNNCNNNVFDRLVTHDNYETGFQLQGVSADNLILDLDSYGNRDPRKNGESADGLGIKEGSGAGNVVRGARLWNNVDDGFDAWKFLSPIQIENSVVWGNGFNRWDFPDFAGDGNGFKLGGGVPETPAAHTIRNSIAFGNAADGFTDNGNAAAFVVDHNTAYANGDVGFEFWRSAPVLTANLAVDNPTPATVGTGTSTGNSWDIGGTWDAAALVSVDPAVITGPRARDGSIRHSCFLRPRGHVDLGARI